MTVDQKLDKLIDFMIEQQEFNKEQKAFNKRLEAKVDRNSMNIERMMNTPTMKKELA